VQAELPGSNARLLDVPEIPTRPSRPNVLLNLALGIAAGMLLGAATAFVRDFFGRSFRSSEETQAVLRCPTLAIVPSFAHHEDDLVIVRAPRSEGAEAFRGLRTALVSDPDRAPKVVVVTSARPGEGKTVASLNLAATLADSGARVLLVDANLYRPACHVALGVANRCGLSSYLRGAASLDAAIQQLDAPRIAFLPAGPVPPSPGALVGSFRMRRLVAALRHEYDFVVLDAPPVLPVSDAVVLAHESDGVVLVVRGDDTPRAAVEVARDRLALTAVPILGVIVNHVDRGWTGLYPGRARDADGPSSGVFDSA
jgi:succinoglycan biosynthesis transport protein ExoP